MPELKKVTNEKGEVAVLYSPGFGAGWFSWNGECPECLFAPEIVALVEQGASEPDIISAAAALFGPGFCVLGADNLKVSWIPAGILFRIDEYDGSETIVLCEEEDWIAA